MILRHVRASGLPAFLCLLSLLVALPAAADPLPLLGGRTARFRAFLVPKRNNAAITISADDALSPLTDPIACPASPTLRVRGAGGFDTGEIVLPCAAWRKVGTGFKYNDRTAAIAGVQSVTYAKRRLVIRMRGEAYPALIGPLDFPPHIEVAFSTGAQDYCARFESFKRNEAGNVVASKPSVACHPAVVTPTPTPVPTPSPSPAPVCPVDSTCAAFAIVPGPGDLLPADDGVATWLRLFDFTGASVFGNATNGAFGPGPIVLARGAVGAGGIAPLTFVGPGYLGANFLDLAQDLGSPGTVCVRIEQDPLAAGWIDCDGGSDADVALSVDSNFGEAAAPSVLLAPGGSDPGAPAGSGVVRVRLRLAVAPVNDAACASLDYSASPVVASAFTTGVAVSSVSEDFVNGAPGTAGPNQVSLSGQPFACGAWGSGSVGGASIVAPLFALDFAAPIVNQIVDVAQVFRLALAQVPLPTATPIATATPAPTPVATATPALSASPPPPPTPSATATAAPTPSPTSAPTPSPQPTATPSPTPTPVPVATTIPAQIGTVTIANASTDFAPNHVALGNCSEAARSSGTLLAQGVSSFSTRFQQSVATDCEAVPTGGGGVSAESSADYTVDFAVTCPAGSTYSLEVTTVLRGAHTINRDNGDGCDLPFFGTTLTSDARMSAVSGAATGGTLSQGGLGLAAPADLSSAEDADLPFERTGSATIVGTGTGAAVAHSLRFGWDASCSSNGDSFNTGSECALRLGLPSELAPNGIAGCMDADDYPGVGTRNPGADGHFVDVTAVCTVQVAPPTPTPAPTATPQATQSPPPTATQAATPMPTPTVTPAPTASPFATPTPGAVPLGPLAFSVAAGPTGYCPADSAAGSFLKTHGSPSGGIPGTVCSGTTGAFTTGPLLLEGGLPDVFGRADLILAAPVVIRGTLDGQTPGCGSSCAACWRFEDDTSATGFVDCDGGSNADQTLIVNSNGTGAPPAPQLDPAWWTLPSGAGDDGPGAAVVRVRVRRTRVSGTTTCPGVGDAAWSGIAPEPLALTTGQATTRIDSPRRCTGSLFGTGCPNANPFTVTLSGTNFSCANWTTNSGARLVVPFVNLDENIGGSFGTGDIAQVLRLDD